MYSAQLGLVWLFRSEGNKSYWLSELSWMWKHAYGDNVLLLPAPRKKKKHLFLPLLGNFLKQKCIISHFPQSKQSLVLSGLI